MASIISGAGLRPEALTPRRAQNQLSSIIAGSVFLKMKSGLCLSESGQFSLELLQLLQLADSALPVGSLAHSYGLETLFFDQELPTTASDVPAAVYAFLNDSLGENLLVECVFCREGNFRAKAGLKVTDLNERLSAMRLARESRDASLGMGRRFAALVARLHPVDEILDLARADELHYSVAFGYVTGLLSIDTEAAVGAFLHQAVLNTISATQRLAPLGQMEANRILWSLKRRIVEILRETRALTTSSVSAFSHLPELASMRHPRLPTRLFIS